MDEPQGNLGAETPQEMARRLGLPFKDFFLLARAMTHRSYMNEHAEAIENNERLEFLGDAVLDFLVGAWLYNRFPEMAEGALTRMRAALVGNEQLANFSRQLGLGVDMRLGRGEAESGGRERPVLLGATFEALVGALYLDQGIQAVKDFVEPLLEATSQKIALDGAEFDAKSRLQEWAQAQGYGPPVYETLSSSGPDHDRQFEVVVRIGGEVYGVGHGNSKRAAAKEAARNALTQLGLY
jgi:ribonuclease-3